MIEKKNDLKIYKRLQRVIIKKDYKHLKFKKIKKNSNF